MIATNVTLLLRLGLLLFYVAWTGSGRAAQYFVSTTGDDSATGLSLESPFRTISRGIAASQPGDTVSVRGDAGVYREQLSITNRVGSSESPFVLETYSGDPAAILDLTGVPIPQTSQKEAIILIQNSQHVTVRRMEFRNFKTAGTDVEQRRQTPAGIYVNCTAGSTCRDITLSECTVQGIWQSSATTTEPEQYKANAHGIIVMGRSANAVSNLVIDSCHVYNLRLGASESIALNGNVAHFSITNTSVHDTNNIGIDFIGHEGFYTGTVIPDVSEDRARFGRCVGNQVYNIDSATNPAYGGNFANKFATEDARHLHRAAGGIYVDGGRDIAIENNDIWQANIGIEVASEHLGEKASNVTVADNRVAHCHIGGIYLGGADTGNGGAERVVICRNTLYQNDSARRGGQILFHNFVTDCAIHSNVIVALPVNGQMPLYILSWSTTSARNLIDDNIYSGVPAVAGLPMAEVGFRWNGKLYNSLSAWQSASGNDAHSHFVMQLRPRSNQDHLSRQPQLLEPWVGE